MCEIITVETYLQCYTRDFLCDFIFFEILLVYRFGWWDSLEVGLNANVFFVFAELANGNEQTY